MTKQPSVKILVCYHKPAMLYKDDVFVPIHLGRALATEASKDGVMSREDYQWMLDNMIGDDTGDNISHLNRYFCELTAIYWAWKNYDKLGSPDYIGLCHYRRLFAKEDIAEATNYDILGAYEKIGAHATIYTNFTCGHRSMALDEACAALKQKFADYAETAQNYLQCDAGYFYNMFIMKKELFFEYCQMLFEVLMPLHQKTDYSTMTYYNQRMPGFLAERLTGIFINYQENKKACQVKHCQARFVDVGAKREISPMFQGEEIAVVFSSDENYAVYLMVAIASIKANRAQGDKYDIVVLDGGIGGVYRNRITTLAADDFSIRFVDISGYLKEVDVNTFALNRYFTIAIYYRFFIPQIFKCFSRVIYLDCDIVVNHNLAELYRTDMKGKALAAVPDVEMHRCLMNNIRMREMLCGNYLREMLKMTHPESYLQAGVLLLDIKKLQEMNFTEVCLRKLMEIKKPLYLDQCVVNAVLDADYLSLDMQWNVLWQLPYYEKNLDHQLSVDKYTEYFAARKKPFIVHYAGSVKPWNNPKVELAEIWWKYARMTPFYEELLLNKVDVKVLKDAVHYYWNVLKYLKYKLYILVTVGKKRKKYRQKKKDLKARLKAVRQFFKEK